MRETINYNRLLLKTATASVALAMAGLASASDLPSMGEGDSGWQADYTYENHTVKREHTGLAKFRNTLQAEVDRKGGGDSWGIHGILRGSWDGVYRMNSSEYGKDAGGAVNIQSIGQGTSIPYNSNALANLQNWNPALSPNTGLRILGDRWHDINGDVAMAVPVRPCDVDSRGCRDFGGYGNLKQREMESPEFNSRLDFIRELYAKKTFALDDGKEMFVKIGKQQVVWGRTDLFRVLDVINPVDYSRNNIYDELSDIRIPMWMVQAEYRMGASETMQDRNFQIVWNFDKFRANNLGQCGSPNAIMDAGCFFRAMANLWDNGGTVSNFAGNGQLATNFGPGTIGIRNVNLPEWSLGNTQIGGKFEGVTQNGLSFSLNALHYRSQLPSLHSLSGSAQTLNGAFGGQTSSQKLIAFDMFFPKVNLVGGSMDFQLPSVGAAVRMEGAMTWGEEFANSMRDQLYSKNRVFRSVIGVDRPTFIPFISKTSATLISAQLFYQHIFDHEVADAPLGKIGMADWKDNFIGTLLFKGFLKNGTVSPQVIFAHDFQARATAIAPQVEWNMTNDLKLTFGANYKMVDDKQRWRFDDCRACGPYAPFNSQPGQAVGQNFGMTGMEPLGRFRAGPIGTAFKENDLFVRVNYKF